MIFFINNKNQNLALSDFFKFGIDYIGIYIAGQFDKLNEDIFF